MRGPNLLLAVLLTAAAAFAGDPAPRPHVVILLADDLGWNDVGYHGGSIPTPNIDRLAGSGVRLERFYVQPVCSPTRAALLTGRYPIRYGLQVGVVKPWANYGLPLEERTLAQGLKQAGYFTAITGKWHLGLLTPEYLPTRRGFDHQYGHYCGALDYFTHKRGEGLDWHRNDEALVEEGYTTELIRNEAVRLIKNHDPKRPMFLYVPFNAVHTPLQAPERYIKRFRDIATRKRRRYAAMVACMDDAIGAILAALDQQGMRQKTLVFFCSDNGGARAASDNTPLRGRKGTLYEGGVRVPAVMAWPGELAPAAVEAPLHIVDLYPTLLRLAGAPRKQPLKLDGVDVWDALKGDGKWPRREILHNLEPKRAALRVGDFKLVRTGEKIELFNLAEDPNEANDLAEPNPKKVKELLTRLALYEQAAVAPKHSKGKKPRDFKAPEVWGE
ncbi:MAG: arylsulfatase B [Planctomycetota bacterium]